MSQEISVAAAELGKAIKLNLGASSLIDVRSMCAGKISVKGNIIARVSFYQRTDCAILLRVNDIANFYESHCMYIGAPGHFRTDGFALAYCGFGVQGTTNAFVNVTFTLQVGYLADNTGRPMNGTSLSAYGSVHHNPGNQQYAYNSVGYRDDFTLNGPQSMRIVATDGAALEGVLWFDSVIDRPG